MNEKTAKGLVTISALGMLAIVGYRRNQLADPFRNAWAAGVIFVGLSLLADIAPEVAGPLALLVLIAAWVKIGKGQQVPASTAKSVASGAASVASGATSALGKLGF